MTALSLYASPRKIEYKESLIKDRRDNMEFCEVCDNLLYLRSENDQNLEKYCRRCNFSKKDAVVKAFKVTSTIYSEDDLLYLQHKNRYLRYDPTLPRVQDPALVCPNKECSAPKDKPQVLYVKYHPVHMKYLYCCDFCGWTWRDEKMM